MKLEELLTRLNYKLVSGSIDIEISDKLQIIIKMK